MQSEREQYMTTAEVAALARAPISSVRYWRHIGIGPASFRLGRRVLYRSTDVHAWLEDIRLSQANAS